MTESQPLLSVANLRVCFHTRNGTTVAVDDMSFQLDKGEILAIVGESGSGKSVACYSLLGLIPTPPGRVESGSARFSGNDLLRMNESQLRDVRGNRISMIFQDPMTSLNPYMRVGAQLVEPLLRHGKLSRQQAREKAIAALTEVGIKNARERIDDYPHQFSGGMRQRVMIAMALINEPELLIADEPTTALDVTVQKQILELIQRLQKSYGMAVIFITHDLAVAATLADRILVMEKGVVVEQGAAGDIFRRAQHPYTRKLLAAIPSSAKPTPAPDAGHTEFLRVDHLHTIFTGTGGGLLQRKRTETRAVDDISLNIRQGEILGLVGESGSGKSTLGRSIMRLIEARSGQVLLDGVDLYRLSRRQLKTARRDFQIIFQDPFASLNPRRTVYDTLAEPLLLHRLATRKTLQERVYRLMDDVGLERSFVRKYPHEFSGGQRQRIAIARALAMEPKLIIADEPVSALDVTIQAQILRLLLELVEKHNLTMLFISHDLAVVRYVSDRVAVMQQGKLVELADTETLFANPQHPYTQSLLSAIPKIQYAD